MAQATIHVADGQVSADNDLSQLILGVICDHGGRAPLEKVVNTIHEGRVWPGMREEDVRKAVITLTQAREGVLFITEKQGTASLISAYTRLILCPDYLTHKGCHMHTCPNLHLCRFFVQGKCKFGGKCKLGHGLRIKRNKVLLVCNFLDKLRVRF